jgi:hypothetical protein
MLEVAKKYGADGYAKAASTAVDEVILDFKKERVPGNIDQPYV